MDDGRILRRNRRDLKQFWQETSTTQDFYDHFAEMTDPEKDINEEEEGGQQEETNQQTQE